MRRDFEALEKRRMAAVRLFPTDLNNSEIGRRLKICDQTVSRWRAQYRAGGESALRKAGRAGRKPLLSTADQKRLVELLEKGPERLGYETPLWTCDRVADLIAQEFEVSYHAGHVWKILRRLNWSVQRPAGRALERDEAGIQRWKNDRWPEIKKSANRRPHDRLHRRKRIKPTAASLPDLGAARADACAAIPLQLEDDLRSRSDGGTSISRFSKSLSAKRKLWSS
jgi:transposase